jgi:large subunit ribosomal protein L9
MEVILLENIDNLGSLGDKVSVKAGYARNFLFPGGKAKPATAANLAEFEAKRAELEKAAAVALTEAEARKAKIEEMAKLTITAKVGSEGKLFGSIGTADIADAVTAAGVEIEKREVRLPEGAIRVVGEHEIALHLYTDVNVSVVVEVIGEE